MLVNWCFVKNTIKSNNILTLEFRVQRAVQEPIKNKKEQNISNNKKLSFATNIATLVAKLKPKNLNLQKEIKET